MHDFLFHPETSTLRALILALGTFEAEDFSVGDLEPLVARLLDLFRNDRDAGIHGGHRVRTLRRSEATGEAFQGRRRRPEASRRIRGGCLLVIVSDQSQLIVVIDRAVEFQIGSPETDSERVASSEPFHRVTIPRHFAIATKEVTVEQVQRFLGANPQFKPNAETESELSH